MTAEIVTLNCQTRLDLPAERILEAAMKADLSEVTLVGYDKDGNLYFASTNASCKDVLWHLRRAEQELMRQTD